MGRNSIVDDVGGGGSAQDITRMRGMRTEEGYDGTVTRMLESHGFKAKALIPSGTTEAAEVEALGGKFLGIAYDVQEDEIILRTVPLIRMKVRRQKQRRADAVVVDEDWLEDLRAGRHQLTKRRVLAYVMAQYDPQGLREPLRMTAKIMLRHLYGSEYRGGWDDVLPEPLERQWERHLSDSLQVQDERIPRALVGGGPGRIWLVAFWDGSLDALATCIYLRWAAGQEGSETSGQGWSWPRAGSLLLLAPP